MVLLQNIVLVIKKYKFNTHNSILPFLSQIIAIISPS